MLPPATPLGSTFSTLAGLVGRPSVAVGSAAERALASRYGLSGNQLHASLYVVNPGDALLEDKANSLVKSGEEGTAYGSDVKDEYGLNALTSSSSPFNNPSQKLPYTQHTNMVSTAATHSASAQLVPYQQRTFADFCMLVGRLFYDDASIVLLDFLVREQRAYTEADIRERLKWRENLLHQKLYYLERQLLLQREQNFEKGCKSPTYWRINPHIVLALEWHYSQLLKRLQEQVEASQKLQEFECSSCKTKHSALDAAAGMLSLEDDHPLCRKCGNRLCPSDSEEAKSGVLDKQQRCLIQLQPLRAAIDKVTNMSVPVFPTYTRADKNEHKRELEERFTTTSPSDSATSSCAQPSAQSLISGVQATPTQHAQTDKAHLRGVANSDFGLPPGSSTTNGINSSLTGGTDATGNSSLLQNGIGSSRVAQRGTGSSAEPPLKRVRTAVSQGTVPLSMAAYYGGNGQLSHHNVAQVGQHSTLMQQAGRPGVAGGVQSGGAPRAGGQIAAAATGREIPWFAQALSSSAMYS